MLPTRHAVFPAISILPATLLILTLYAQADPFFSNWTSNDGVMIEARLLGWDGSHFLLSKDGRQYRVPPTRLDCPSRQKARRMLAQSAIASVGSLPSPESTASRPGPSLEHQSLDRHGMPFYDWPDRVRKVRTTAYTHSESDHLVYGRKNAVGTQLQFNSTMRSAAADWSRYPVGTIFRIKGLPHLHVVDDYGSALVGTATIDLYQPTRAAMNRWGCRRVEIEVVEWGCFERSARILRSRAHHDHCRQMLEVILLRSVERRLASKQ